MRTALARTIAEGRLQIRDSIIEAKSSLLSIGASLSDQISQIIDSGPGGQRLAQLQAQLAGRQSAGEKRRLRRDVRDAKEQLASAQGSITHIPDTLSARERAIQKKRIEAFLRPFREKVQDAEDAIKDFNTQAVIDRLEKTQEKQKAAVTKGISDIIAEFETGQITSAQATRKIAGIVGSFQPDFHVAGNKLGVAFRLGFKAEIDALVAQIKAISVPAVAKRDNKKFPGPSVVEPAQVIAQAQRDQIEAQNRLREATHKNRLAVQALTSEPTGYGDERMLEACRYLSPIEVTYPSGVPTCTFKIDSPLPYVIDKTPATVGVTPNVVTLPASTVVAVPMPTFSTNYWPVIRVNGAFTGFTIVNQSVQDEYGDDLKIVYSGTRPGAVTVGGGSYAEIVCFNETIYLNGNSSNLKPGIDPTLTDFFYLKPGINNIVISGASATMLVNYAWPVN
jgi:hypothetical protein